MDWWEIVFGGVTGLIGTIWSGYNQRKTLEITVEDRRQQRRHELAMVRAESDATIAEAEANVRVTQAQVEGAESLANAQAFGVSQQVGNVNIFLESFMERMFSAKGKLAYIAQPVGVFICLLFGIVDTVKGLARPIITTYLLSVSTWIAYVAWDVVTQLGRTISVVQALELQANVTSVLLYTTVVAVTWWFGDRMTAKGMRRASGNFGLQGGA